MNFIRRSAFRLGWPSLALALAACGPPPPGADGVSADTYIPRFIATIATACAQAGFDPAKVRARLLQQGFVEQRRPLITQLERFPDGASALTQGVVTPSATPCRPAVNARYAQQSVNAAGLALIAAGYKPESNRRFFVKGATRVRLQSRSLSTGGLATMKIEPV